MSWPPRTLPWRRLAAIAVVAGAVASTASWHLTIRADSADARQELDATRAALASASAARARIDDALDEARAEHHLVEEAIDEAAEAADATRAAAGAASAASAADRARADDLHGERVLAEARQESAAVDLYASASQLDGLRQVIAALGGQLGDLRTCVSGVLAAAAAVRADSSSDAVRELHAVAEACARAKLADDGELFPYDFPDPYIVQAGSTYYGYATNSAGGAVQMIRSRDLRHWEWVGGALSDVPAWAKPGATWAPSVAHLGGRWLLYYTVRHGYTGQQCISVAIADRPTGPFVDRSSQPLVCDHDRGGSIDPSPYLAPDGRPYLLWKAEGETVGGDAELVAQALRPDGLALKGHPSVLLRPAAAWEGRTVEAPSMATTDAGTVLLYSGSSWDRSSYAVGAAICDTPLGPCWREPGPALASTGSVVGPGGAELFRDERGALRFAYHSWQPGEVGYPHSRYLRIGAVTVDGGRVHLSG